MTDSKIPVLYLTHFSDISGAEKSLVALINGLRDSPYTPIVAVPKRGRLSELCIQHEIPVEHIPIPLIRKVAHPSRVFHGMINSTRAMHQLYWLVRRNNIRIIHANSLSAAIVVGPVARLAHVPQVVHIRDILRNPQSGALLLKLAVDRFSDAAICVSVATRDSLIALNENVAAKSHVIYNGIDIQSFTRSQKEHRFREELGLTSSTPLVGVVGQLTPWKGVHCLLRAISLIDVRVPDARFVVVGEALWPSDQQYARGLCQLAEDLGVSNRVFFTGFRDDIPDVLAELDVLVHAAVEADPFPRTVLEGMAAGKPVVASAVGGVPEMIIDKETGILFEPNNVVELASAVSKLLQNPSWAKALGGAARQRASDSFSQALHARQVKDIYSSLIAKRK